MTNHEKQMAAIERQCKAANCGCVPEGWKLVPVEPTAAQLYELMSDGEKDAAIGMTPEHRGLLIERAGISYRYAAMLAAAPAAPTEGARDDCTRIQGFRDCIDAIRGAIAFGMQNVNRAPNEEHWLAEFWNIGRELGARDAGVGTAVMWQWRKKPDAWSLDRTFTIEVFATTDDSEVRALYAHPDPLLAEAVEALDRVVYSHDHQVECGGSLAEDLVDNALDFARSVLDKVQAAKEQAS